MKKILSKCRLFQRNFIALGLISILTFSLAACGNANPSVPEGSGNTGDDFVYIAQYQDIGIGDAYNSVIANGYIYSTEHSWDEETQMSSTTLYKTALTGGAEKESLPIQIASQRNIYKMLVTPEDEIILFLNEYIEMPSATFGYQQNYFLLKYDSSYNLIFENDISSLAQNTDYFYINNAVLDDEGNIYVAAENQIILFRGDGTMHNTISVDNYISGMGKTKDGKVCVSYYNDTGTVLSEVDFATGSLDKPHANFPGNQYIYPGIEKDVLTYDSNGIYEYDIATETCEVLLSWLDSDINGQYVERLYISEDGQLNALYRDWTNDTQVTEMVTLVKTEASTVAEKEIITIGTLYTSQLLQSMAVNFNKSNNTYRIKIQTFMDTNNWSETSYQDAITAINTAIAGGDCPDILVLTNDLPITSYSAKGLLEDLNTYLDASTVFNRSDFVPAVLDAYTYEGQLIGLVDSFYVQTILGKTSLLGDRKSWTLDELLAFAAAHPDAELFDYATKSNILDECLRFSQDTFIDYAAGECYFDTDEFKKVLEYANLFPEEYVYDEDAKSTPRKIQDNELLLNKISIGETQAFQMYLAMFEEPVTCIGYPTSDGGNGNFIYSSNGAFAISSQSEQKEGAWTFLEYFLANSSDNKMYSYGFSSLLDVLENTFKADMEEEYVLDENGEIMLDENGEAMTREKTSWGYDDWQTDIYAATQEQIDLLWSMINNGRSATASDNNILTIIMEEAQPYFSGQKSVDDVAKVIQSRLKIYINENM